MTDLGDDAAGVVARAISRKVPAQRAPLLIEIMHHAAAAYAVIEGEKAAAEAVYRLGDAVVARTPPR